MAHDLTVRNEGDFLQVQVTGTRTREAVLAVVQEVLQACVREATQKVLLDLREFEGRLSLSDAYELPAKRFPELQSAIKLRTSAVAIVDAQDSLDRFALIADVATSRGLNLRLFDQMTRAREWLVQDDG